MYAAEGIRRGQTVVVVQHEAVAQRDGDVADEAFHVLTCGTGFADVHGVSAAVREHLGYGSSFAVEEIGLGYDDDAHGMFL